MGLTIAVDGPAASGKGTISRAIAAHFGLGYLDTGLLYRAVGHRMLRGEDPVEAAQGLTAEDLDREGLRGPDAAQAASRVAAIPEVRAALIDFQRAFAAREGGAVLDGRDIGTVICPDAPVKIFVTADAQTRAERRFRDLVAAGHRLSLDEVLADIRARDARDAGRADAPMRPADDAVTLDTTQLSVEEAIAAAIGVIERKGGDGP
jgi:cytidylate kinase